MKAFFVVTFLLCLSLAASTTSSAGPSLKPIPTSAISGLKCYYCIGDTDSCSKKKLEQNKHLTLHSCQKGMCMRTWVKEDDRVTSGCVTAPGCEALLKYKCDNKAQDECTMSCCNATDGCNTGSSVSISCSVFLVTMCSVLGLVLLK